MADSAPFWNQSAEQLLSQLNSSPQGLAPDEAERRLAQFGPNALKYKRQLTPFRLLVEQVTNPLVLILIGAAVVSFIAQEWTDAGIIVIIVISSVLLGYMQEYSANIAIAALTQRLMVKATVLRAGSGQEIPATDVVPGDVVSLSAGSLIPADGLILESNNFFVSQAALTGETFPVEKKVGVVPAEASLIEQTNCAFMGTSVRSGTAKVLIARTGARTIFGELAQRLTRKPPQTEFERGIFRFGYLLAQFMVILTVVVLAANLLAHKPAIDSLLFSVALAVGLTPELLPTIITINLSRCARHMATQGVFVRHLNSIENLGSMDVLCTDKTGTVTEGIVTLRSATDENGESSTAVLRLAYLNAVLQAGLANPLDDAIVTFGKAQQIAVDGISKVGEIPYDFERRRLSVIVQLPDQQDPLMITKGALDDVLKVCDRYQAGEQVLALDDAAGQAIAQKYHGWSEQGLRVLGIASKPAISQQGFGRDDEHTLIFRGFLLFFDPPKKDAAAIIANLERMGVQIKIITGDNRLVARYVAELVGIDGSSLMTGTELNSMPEDALCHRAETTSIFAEIAPNQKERIIRALQKTKHVVGYMGDGINDAPALYAADVGISVEDAVDVAKEAAGLVLTRPDLNVLRIGIEDGRKSFANSLKYILTTTSANFGNMLSMAGASIFLPFLPLLAKQILLNNFLSDIPGTTIADDEVDSEWIEAPHRWNILFIRNFMVVFGLVSSLFDFLTFGLLYSLLHASPEIFRTGWFIESLLTELVIALVVRTRKPFYRSRPGKWLTISTIVIALITFTIPYWPFAEALGFVPLPFWMLALLTAITLLYVAMTEIVKYYFYRHRWGKL